MTPRISVVIPAYNAEALVADAVRAVLGQPIPRDQFECIVVDDGSRDRTAAVAAQAGAIVVSLKQNSGIAGARNAGIQQAKAEWIAFTDSDCVPSRRWLSSYIAAAQSADRFIVGLAGKTIGLDSKTPAARFMDLIGALDSENYLTQGAFSWAPGGNIAYRRADLLAVDGFDTRLRTYEVADLQVRITNKFGGTLQHVPTALIMHRHRTTWRELWKQQLNYGRGYGTFLLLYADRWPWSMRREMEAWLRLLGMAGRAAVNRGDRGLAHRGMFVKHLAQRLGFISNYFSAAERKRLAGGPLKNEIRH